METGTTFLTAAKCTSYMYLEILLMSKSIGCLFSYLA